ncbi:MAG: polysaccharide biosynthesis protein [Bacilli bacterium]
MKKDTFIKGALVSTICIVLSKILGIIYVIPFNNIIGKQGGALYGYAYNIYILFLNLSTVGIPLAVSKIVSEYNTLGYHDVKRRTYKQAIIVTSIMSVITTIILYVFAYDIAVLIKGGVSGGNSLEDIAFVIKISASAIFFVTILSDMRGFLQGQKYITSSSISEVVEQLVRIIIIIFGSYIFVKLFGIKEAVGIAIFGATVGAIAALIYLAIKGKKELKIKDINYDIKEEEKKITNKVLLKKIIICTIPFIILSVIVSLYTSVDMFTVIKTLVNSIGVNANDAEYVMSCISTWGAKLNVIVTSISSGIVVSLLPNITSDFAINNYKAICDKTNKTIQIILLLVIPMVFGLSFLASPVWNLFYNNNPLGVEVFSYSIFTALFSGLFININVILQGASRYKVIYIELISGLLFKIVMNVPFIILFSKLGFPAIYGAISATILGYLISIILGLIDLKKAFKIKYKESIKVLIVSLAASIIMILILYLLKQYIPITNLGKLKSLLVVILYGIIGLIIYIIIIVKTGIFKQIFGNRLKG